MKRRALLLTVTVVALTTTSIFSTTFRNWLVKQKERMQKYFQEPPVQLAFKEWYNQTFPLYQNIEFIKVADALNEVEKELNEATPGTPEADLLARKKKQLMDWKMDLIWLVGKKLTK